MEQPFNLKLDNYAFKGRIDRIDLREDGKVDIVDYKTGSLRRSIEKVDKDQLLIYKWAAEEALGEKVNEMSYWYLENLKEILPFEGDAQDVETLKSQLLQTISEIVRTLEANNFLEEDLRRRHSRPCKFRDLEG